MKEQIPVCIFGISHHTAPVEIREKVALNTEEQKSVLKQITDSYSVDGALILSTCNRTEVYLSGEHSDAESENIRQLLNEIKNTAHYTDASITYQYHDEEAVRHFFKVISGIDSQIVGEVQITGQVKDGYNLTHELNTADTLINKLFNYGMQTKKKVFNDTFLYDGTVSVSFAGVELARKIFSDLTNKNILLIGAGKTAELAAGHFLEHGAQRIHVVNRTLSKAKELAEKFNGTAYQLDDLPKALMDSDIVISATSSDEFVITPELISPVVKARHRQPIFLIDLAIPRDLDPKINSIDGVYLYNLDDLQEIVKSNLESRKKEIPKSLKIVDEFVEEFKQWISTHSMSVIVGKIKKRLDTLRLNEIDRLKKHLPANGYKEGIDQLTESIVNKVVRQHVKTLKKHASDPEKYQQQIELIYNLYELDEE
jgi:glutamyl-tRNA reductase